MKPDPERRRGRLRSKLLLAACATAAVLVASEVALRVFHVADRSFYIHVSGISGTVQDDDLFWRFTPRGGHDPIHEIGIRGDVFTTPRTERDLRILCVGDSCTWGFPILPHEAYGMVLGRRIQEVLPDACVETVLAAAPGYTTHQDLALLGRHGALFAADVTILYVGSWNDLFLASGYRDSEYAAEIDRLEHHPLWSMRLGRILWRTLHPIPTVEEKKKKLEHAPVIEQSAAARVSLEEFRANVRALVAFGRASGVVLGVVPPSTTLAKGMPWAREYRRVLVETYRDLGVPSVDCDEAFRAFGARLAETGIASRDFMCEGDDVHPSAIGHAALAAELEPLLLGAAAARVGALKSAPPWKRATVASVAPRTLAPGRRASIRVEGAGFAGPASPRQVFAGGRAVSRFRVIGDATVELEVEPELLCRPGPLAIELRSPAGVVRAAPAPEVLAWTPEASIIEHDGRSMLRVSVDAESSLFVVAWFSAGVRQDGRGTKWGRFLLEEPPREGEGPLESQVAPLAPGLPIVECGRPEPGPAPLVGETAFPADPGREGAQAPRYAQVFIRYGYAPEEAWLSGVLNVTRK